MNRRDFIKTSGLIAALPLLPSCLQSSSSSGFRIGLQLYTVRDAMEEDPLETLMELKAMGYQDFESYGYDAAREQYYGFAPAEFKAILDDLELSTSSGHYGVNGLMEAGNDVIKRYVDSCIKGAMALDDPYIVFPMLDQKYHSEEGYRLLVKRLNQMGKQISEAGLGFAYHNFGYDFLEYGGRTGMDWVIEETDPDYVKLEVDFYWVMHANKISPKDLINKARGRFRLWHIKDMHKKTRDYTELGNGSIDYTSVLPDAKDSGLEYYYIEQGSNFAKDSMSSVKQSIEYFKANVQALI